VKKRVATGEVVDLELMAIGTDAILTDLYHRFGLLTAPEDASYDVERVLRFMRAAFWHGVRKRDNDSAGELERLAGTWVADPRVQRAA